MTIEAMEFAAQDAKALLENPMFINAFDKVENYIESRALEANPDNKDITQRIILSKQILAHIKREIVKVITDYEVEVIRIGAIDKPKIFKNFRRY